MKFILGKKVEMTQRFQDDGKVTPVTVVEAGPCVITQVKINDKDGYQAVQIGYDARKKISRPQQGHLKELEKFRILKEFRFDDEVKLKRGDAITASLFQAGEKVSVVGVSKGKGFQGVVRRHGFSGGKGSHGDKDQLRAPGSIGATDAARVFKGKKMAGQMGDSRVTVKNLEIIEVDSENKLIFIKGALPGARHGILMISAEGEMQLEKSGQKEPAPKETERPKGEGKVDKKTDTEDKKAESQEADKKSVAQESK